jgi:hypothetical protein
MAEVAVEAGARRRMGSNTVPLAKSRLIVRNPMESRHAPDVLLSLLQRRKLPLLLIV